MKCEAITRGNTGRRYRRHGVRPCPYDAAPGSRFCIIHAPDRLIAICERRIARLSTALEMERARLASLQAAANPWPGNPS